MVKPVEQGITKNATPLSKSESTGPLGKATDQNRESAMTVDVAAMVRGRNRKREPKLEITEQIGQRLRSVYNEVLFQPVPGRFHDLIRALEEDPAAGADPSAAGSGGGRMKDLK